MRGCYPLMNALLTVSVFCACTRVNYAWEPTGSALAPFSEEIPVSLSIWSTQNKISNDSFVLGIRFGKEDDALTTNDMFRDLSDYILKQRREIEHLSSASGSQPERYFYMGMSGDIILTADRPLLGRSAGEDLSDLFELYAYSGTSITNRGLLLLSFPEFNQQLYVSNETITSGSNLSLNDILKDGFSVARTEYYFKPNKTIDTSDGPVTLQLRVPVLGKTVMTDHVEGTVPKVIDVNDKSVLISADITVTKGDDCVESGRYILPKGRPLFRRNDN